MAYRTLGGNRKSASNSSVCEENLTILHHLLQGIQIWQPQPLGTAFNDENCFQAAKNASNGSVCGDHWSIQYNLLQGIRIWRLQPPKSKYDIP